MIGIIGAMKIEVDCITSLMKDKTIETISSIEYHKGKINGKDCVCAIGGVGKVNAAICTQTMILKYGCSRRYNKRNARWRYCNSYKRNAT